jgi:two-component SAPR family response regulator
MKKVILSVNPLKAMNFLIETVLSPKHTVILVPNAVVGMQVLKNRGSVDVIIIDGDLDCDESLEFIYHVRNSRLYTDCVLVSLSSQFSVENNSSLHGFMDQVFQKPFSPQQLIDYVNKLPEVKTLNSI